MKQLLHINSSLWGNESRSSQLADTVVAQLTEQLNEVEVIKRDLSADPVPHLSAEAYDAFSVPAEQRSVAQQQALALSDTLIDELRTSEVIVLTAPMYNYGVPSALKAWIDHVARINETFAYGERGMEGLLGGKKVIVVSTRGGKHAGTETDLQTPVLKQVFGMMGITDVEFIYAEALAFGEEAAAASLQQAREQIAALTL